MESRESIVFYKSYYDAISRVAPKYQLELYKAILAYAFNKIEPKEMSSVALAMFTLIKPNIDSAQKRYDSKVENGKKGGRPRKTTEQKPNENLNETEIKPNENLDETETKTEDNLNDNVDYNANSNSNIKEDYKFVKPSLEDIKCYCQERNNKVDAEQLFNFYESKGWKVGNQSMKDWKACVRTWEKRVIMPNSNLKHKQYCQRDMNVDWNKFYDN